MFSFELPNSQKEINSLNGRQGIIKGVMWIKNYHEVLNPNNNKISANWYIPNHEDGLLEIKKRLIFLYKIYNKSYEPQKLISITTNILNKKNNNLGNKNLNNDKDEILENFQKKLHMI